MKKEIIRPFRLFMRFLPIPEYLHSPTAKVRKRSFPRIFIIANPGFSAKKSGNWKKRPISPSGSDWGRSITVMCLRGSISQHFFYGRCQPGSFLPELFFRPGKSYGCGDATAHHGVAPAEILPMQFFKCVGLFNG